MKRFFVPLAVLALTLSACTPPNTEGVHIVTTIAPLYSLTANLIEGAQNVELSNIVPANASVHSFSLSPKIAKQISEADIIIMNGLELEEFLEGNLSASDALLVDTSENVPLLKFPEAMTLGGAEEEEGEQHGIYDPHIWLSPSNATIQAESIKNALVEIDPANSPLYESNFIDLSARLAKLTKDSRAELEKLNIEPYIVFHDAYQYFELEFNVSAIGFLEESVGNEPSAQYMASLIDIIKSNGVVAIFAEPQFSPKLIQTLADDYGLKKGELDPLGQKVSKDGYFDLIESNVDSFKMMFTK